jgi:protein phosphatase
VISSDFCRGLVADDENDQSATEDAFAVLHFITRKRLAAGRLTVIDATNVQPESRKALIEIAREYHVLPAAIVFNLPERLCEERNASRPDRQFGPHVVRRQAQQLRRSLRNLQREGFRNVYVLNSPEQVEAVSITRQPLWTDRRHEHGPFDIIGDIHGCRAELVSLLGQLGYRRGQSEVGSRTSEVTGESEPADTVTWDSDAPPLQKDASAATSDFAFVHPEGRRAVFLGDLVDRGPDSPGVLRIVMEMVAAGSALCVPGNHEAKLLRKLQGRNVQLTHGLAETMEQMAKEPPEFAREVATFIDGLVSHFVLDDGKLVVAHAGMQASMQGRASNAVRAFALYGDTTGETDEYGLPVRYPWATEYRGRAAVVYGHTPVPEPEWLNNTICLDTGCVFGGRLTALRWPERELVSVPAARVYYEPARPFPSATEQPAPTLTAQQQHDEVLDIDDVRGKRIISTRLMQNIIVGEGHGAAALEVMSRFAADPKWLIYLPPTMSPSETSKLPGLLEHPAEAFAYYRAQGVERVVCEEKHMGSRAVVIVCREMEAARRRFGVTEGNAGVVLTRTGRPFFSDAKLEANLLDVVRRAMDGSSLWDELATDWVCLDCELMPWSAKAQELLRGQYAAAGSSSRFALSAAVDALARASARDDSATPLLERLREREVLAQQYVEAYRRYCWPVDSLADLRLAPFHLLATEGAVHTDKDHCWHMDTLGRLCTAGEGTPLFRTALREVDLSDAGSEAEGVRWWEELTGRGGEGMVVKPLDFIARGQRGIAQPAVKVRGPEYLRIIYGPEYTLPENLERLRRRGLSAKRGLALREFALGVEALERFVRREPLRRVHECTFAVLALESEPVDPRL